MDYCQTVFVQRILDFAYETLQRHILHHKRFSKFSFERKYVLSNFFIKIYADASYQGVTKEIASKL